MSELSKTARKIAFRSANEALRRDIRYAELRDALRLLRDAARTVLSDLGPSDRAVVDAALVKAEKALADSEPK